MMAILDCLKQSCHLLGSGTHQCSKQYPNTSPARPPSPNCQCSCHLNYDVTHQLQSKTAYQKISEQKRKYQHQKLKQQSQRLPQHQYFPVREEEEEEVPHRTNDILLLGHKRSVSHSGLNTSDSGASTSQRVAAVLPSGGAGGGGESNYCDISELYGYTSERITITSSPPHFSGYYFVRPKPPNILLLVRLDPFKFPTMEPLQVSSRLIVFSLVDNFTKLSPNKIFENYIQKLKKEGRKSITIFNMSEPIEYMRTTLEVPICEFGWPEKHAPSLEKLCSLCKAIDSWLALDSSENTAVLYSKRDLSRSSLAIGVFLQYVRICLGDDSTFDYESMRNYYEHNLQQYLQPSQKRYISYFTDLLSGESKINSNSFILNQIILHKIPNFEGDGTCKPFIKIYQGLNLIYNSPVLNIDSNYLNKHDIAVFVLRPPLKLRGEILIKCYHRRFNPSSRTVMFSLQFHTGTFAENNIFFRKDDIDIATYDKRFHADTQIELMFNDAKLSNPPEVGLLEDDPITKWNSYENFFTGDLLEYTEGPIDGSLYATISKRTNDRLLEQSQHTTTATVKPNMHQEKAHNESQLLDELLNEIFTEIEDLPDLASPHTDNKRLLGVTVNSTNTTSTANSMDLLNSQIVTTDSVTTNNHHQATTGTHHEPSNAESKLTWLQKQQLKLRKKQDNHLQKRNLVEQQLITELKHTIQKQHSFTNESNQDELYQSSPTIPVRSSSKNIMLQYPEQQQLAMPVQTLSLDRLSVVSSSGQPKSPYSSLVRQSSLHQQTTLDHSSGHLTFDANISPIHRTSTPSFPVKDDWSSTPLSRTIDYNSTGPKALFIKDTSSFWYKPHISREQAVKLLLDKPSGSFLIRDSNSFQGAYGLALKVSSSGPADESNLPESVRHFLIESTNKGVQIKGCPEEPVFSSLAALVNQHSITRISLPTTLLIPSEDIEVQHNGSSLHRIYENGAACNVLYFACENIESLTGPQAIRKVIDMLLELRPSQIKSTVVHFKASSKGITLTDNSHKLFFRQHYALQSISSCCLDPENRSMVYQHDNVQIESVLFGFVSLKKGSTTDNECLIFGQYEPDQPSQAIVDFVNKLLLLEV